MALDNNNADIKLLFGVATSAADGGDSEGLIRDQLQAIINNVNKQPIPIKVALDKDSENTIRSQISSIMGSINLGQINIGGIGSGAGRGIASGLFGGLDEAMSAERIKLNDISEEYKKSLLGMYREFYDVASGIGASGKFSSPDFSKRFRDFGEELNNIRSGSSVRAVERLLDSFMELQRLAGGLNPQYAKILTVDPEQLQKIQQLKTEYREASKEAHNAQNQMAKQPEATLAPEKYDELVGVLKNIAELEELVRNTVDKTTEAIREQISVAAEQNKAAMEQNEQTRQGREDAESERRTAAAQEYVGALKSIADAEASVANTVNKTTEAIREQISALVEQGNAAKEQAEKTRQSREESEKIRRALAVAEKLYALKEKMYTTKGSDIEYDDETKTYKSPSGQHAVLAQDITDAQRAYDNLNKSAREHEAITQRVERLEERLAAVREQSAARQKDADKTERETLTRNAETLLGKYQNAQNNWTAMKYGKTSGMYEEIVKTIPELQDMISTLNNGGGDLNVFKERLEKASGRFREISSAAKQANENTSSFSASLKKTAKFLGGYFNSYRIIQYMINAMKKMVKASMELESAFAQLKIITGATDAEMQTFSATAVRMAQDLGQSVASVTKSIEVFSRLGYGLEDAAELAKYATIMSNVAGVDLNEATTGITSIVKGFNLDVSDAGRVADILVQVGQKYAVSASEMMDAYEKSGAALNATNTSLEKSAGLIAAANAAVQNSGIVGRIVPIRTVMCA